MGHDVRIFMPYRFLPDKMAIPKIQSGTVLPCSFAVFETILPGTDVPLYLLSSAFSPPSLLGKMKTGGLPCLPMGQLSSAGITGNQKLSIAMTVQA